MASKVAAISLRNVAKPETPEIVPQKSERKSRKRRETAAIMIQSIVRMKFGRTQLEYLMLKKRLKGMGAQTKSDLERIQADVAKKKRTLKERAKAKMDARARQGDQLQDSQKLITYLKEDNSNIRARNAKLEVNMRNLQTNNMRLTKNSDAGEDYHRRLQLHHEKVVSDNIKLTKSLNDLKKKVAELEDELIEKSRESALEHSIRCLQNGFLSRLGISFLLRQYTPQASDCLTLLQ